MIEGPRRRIVQLTLVVCTAALLVPAFAVEQRPLDFADLMKFSTISEAVISDDGAWVAYSLWPDRGDGEVVVRATDGSTEHLIERGSEPVISSQSRWAAALVKPTLEELEKAENEEDRPKTGMALVDTGNGEVITRERVERFAFSESGGWLAYLYFAEEEEGDEDEGDQETAEEDEEDEADDDDEERLGTTLALRELSSGREVEIAHVTDFAFDEPGLHLAYAVAAPEGEGNALHVRLLGGADGADLGVHAKDHGRYTCLVWPEHEPGRLAFVAAVDEDGEPGDGELWTWDPTTRKAHAVATTGEAREGWFIPSANELEWSRDGVRLFFGFKPDDEKPDEADDDEDGPFDAYDVQAILEDRGVDVWHWDDPLIIPNQKKQWEEEEKDRSYRAVLHANSGEVVALADREMRIVKPTDTPRSALGLADTPYLKEITWDDSYHDVYLVALDSGSRQLVVPHLASNPTLSPDGRYVVYYLDRHWFLFDGSSGATRNLSAGLDVPFANEDHDYPRPAPGYGVADWVAGDRAVLIYDKYDVWLFPTADGDAVCLTEGRGRQQDTVFRLVDLDEERDFLLADEQLLLSGYHEREKTRSFFRSAVHSPGVSQLAGGSFNLDAVAKARAAERLLYTRQSFSEFPDLWIADLDLGSPAKLSNANPQIAEHAWGEAELVEWLSADGLPLQGALIKPADYEPGKRYPVLVYYYRFFSQRLHNFNEPVVNHRPSFPVYASHGYAVFLPDIRFEVGRPGFSATKCLVPGVQRLIDMGVADPEAIGLHGHSWSGYQTAFVVTQTDLFAAAVAGAPVSNMTSAYGGIRWGSGRARQFQYEQSQSRLGASLWEARDLYIDSSPLFFADRINTPLLIQHGDQDEAVPWYQSIELYLAMRRLGKNCIFLQYRDEPHHLKVYANKLDYSIKMKQFFDHHLKGEPAPQWMTKGVPYRGE